MKYIMALVILLSLEFTANTALAADNNGHGFVYHRSDCSPGYVRVYGDGGRGDGNFFGCGQFLSEFAMEVIHTTDYNFNVDQLTCLGTQFSFQNYWANYHISDDELRNCDLEVLINPEFKKLFNKKVRFNRLSD
jgi:hypothetical protein